MTEHQWRLINNHQQRGGRYFTIEVDHIRIADIFPDAGMYRGKTDPEWVIEQVQRIIDTMNTKEREARIMTAPTLSPLPFELVEATEHHGLYITTQFGTTICDFYAMSNPTALSTASGGTSTPIPFVDAEGNARLFLRAVNSHAPLLAAAKYAVVVLEDYESAGTTTIGSVIADLLVAITAAEESQP